MILAYDTAPYVSHLVCNNVHGAGLGVLYLLYCAAASCVMLSTVYVQPLHSAEVVAKTPTVFLIEDPVLIVGWCGTCVL